MGVYECKSICVHVGISVYVGESLKGPSHAASTATPVFAMESYSASSYESTHMQLKEGWMFSNFNDRINYSSFFNIPFNDIFSDSPHSLPTCHLATMVLCLLLISHKAQKLHKAQRWHNHQKSQALILFSHLFGEHCLMVAGSWGVYWNLFLRTFLRPRAYQYVGLSIPVTTTYKLL